MKIRNGYVSNSSSSSFIVNKDLSKEHIFCIKLNKEQIERVFSYIKNDQYNDEEIPENYQLQNWWLTTLISDTCDAYTFIKYRKDKLEETLQYQVMTEYDKKKLEKRYDFNALSYMEGGHGFPYGDDEDYIILEKDGIDFYLNKDVSNE